jgi:integrase
MFSVDASMSLNRLLRAKSCSNVCDSSWLVAIPLGPHAVKTLTGHRKRVHQREPNDLVFSTRKGEPFRESKLLTRVLQPAAVKAGLGRVTWHQFRHIHSSLMSV